MKVQASITAPSDSPWRRRRQNTSPVHRVTPASRIAAESPAVRMSRITKMASQAHATAAAPSHR